MNTNETLVLALVLCLASLVFVGGLWRKEKKRQKDTAFDNVIATLASMASGLVGMIGPKEPERAPVELSCGPLGFTSKPLPTPKHPENEATVSDDPPPGLTRLWAMPQVVFRGERLILTSNESLEDLLVHDIKIGKNSLFPSGEPISALCFHHQATDTGMLFDAANIGQLITIVVGRTEEAQQARQSLAHKTDRPRVRATLIGRYIG